MLFYSIIVWWWKALHYLEFVGLVLSLNYEWSSTPAVASMPPFYGYPSSLPIEDGVGVVLRSLCHQWLAGDPSHEEDDSLLQKVSC